MNELNSNLNPNNSNRLRNPVLTTIAALGFLGFTSSQAMAQNYNPESDLQSIETSEVFAKPTPKEDEPDQKGGGRRHLQENGTIGGVSYTLGSLPS